LPLFRRRAAQPSAAEALYQALVRQARQPAFYARLGVPDSLDGRFDMVTLHVALTLIRLKAEGSGGTALGQALFDAMFADMDRSLREIGVGDLSVGKRVQQMASAFYGRLDAYEKALGSGPEALKAALARNLYGTVTAEPAQIAAMAAYVGAAAAKLQLQPFAELAAGRIEFPPLEIR